MLRTVRIAARLLLKQPGFTVMVVLTLALGIGATAAVFSLIQGVLLTPPPYREPERLAIIPSGRIDGQPAGPRGWATLQLAEWQQQSTAFESLAVYSWGFNFLVEADGSQSLEGLVVTPDYFRVTGVQPVLGRAFVESDQAATGPPPVIVLGYDLWKRQFNGDPNIVGKTLRMSRRDSPPTIIGVMPPGVRFLPVPAAAQEPNYNVNAVVDFLMPAGRNPAGVRQPGWNVVGRLRHGVTPEQAQAELRTITARQAQTERDFEGFAPRVQPLTDDMNRDGRRILLPLFGAAVLVLLIACGNTAALLLVRGLQRQQEYAMRTALGISRLALFGQASVESLLLAVMGGACGIGLAVAIVKVFKAIGGHAIPRLDAVAIGWPVLLAGVAAALFAAVLAGVLPAVRATRLNPIEVLKSAGPNSSAGRGERRRLRAVTMVQMALTLALLVGAGLLMRTMSNLANVRSGYTTGHILTMTVTMVQGNWADLHTRALERVSAVPGVQQAAFAWGVPLTGNSWPGSVEIEGRPVAAPSDRVPVPQRSVTPGYFSLLGLTVAEGRDFRSSDVPDAPPVAIVNQSFVERYFAPANAIGKKLWFRGRGQPAVEIIGVVSNGRTDDLTRAADPEVYFSLWQRNAFSKDLVVRAAGDARSVIAAVQSELRGVDPTAAIENIRTLDQIRADSLASRRFAMQLLVGFSLAASVLTLVGIYGVLSLSVAARRRDFAIRTAIGAQHRDIRKLVLTEGFRLIAGGVAAGVVVATVLSRVLASLLFEVEPADPTTLAAAGLLFAAVALLACWVPTRRAARVSPLEALRCE